MHPQSHLQQHISLLTRESPYQIGLKTIGIPEERLFFKRFKLGASNFLKRTEIAGGSKLDNSHRPEGPNELLMHKTRAISNNWSRMPAWPIEEQAVISEPFNLGGMNGRHVTSINLKRSMDNLLPCFGFDSSWLSWPFMALEAHNSTTACCNSSN